MADTPVTPTPIGSWPTAPQRTDAPATFVTRADAWTAATSARSTEMNALAANMKYNADSAFASAGEAAADAATASAAATSATSTANATLWVSGTTYALTDSVISPIDFQTYRRIIAGAGTTDPSADGTNWTLVGPAGSASDYQAFTASGTWTKPEGASFVLVEAFGGGGGGANHTSGDGNASGASGGEYVLALFRTSDIPSSVTVTVGAGGAGGASGGVNDGSSGGSTSFGSLITAIGGNKGVALDYYVTIPRSSIDSIHAALSYPYILNANGAHERAGYGGAPNRNGGNCLYGGGGGGGRSSSSNGGVSEIGGNGGSGNDSAGVKAGNGESPSGGGGGSGSDGGGGDGARGEVRVWAW